MSDPEPTFCVIIVHFDEKNDRFRPCIESYWRDFQFAVDKAEFLIESGVPDPIHIAQIDQFGIIERVNNVKIQG